MRYRMTEGRRRSKLRNDVAGIRRVRYVPQREIPEFRSGRLSRRRSVATKAVLILVLRRHDRSDSITGRNSIHSGLGWANERRRRECLDLLRSMRVVAVSTGGMAIVVQKNRLCAVVHTIPGGIWMIGNFCEFCINIRDAWNDIVIAVVAGYAVLGVSVHVR